MIRLTAALLIATALTGVAQARTLVVAPGPDAQERVQTALLDAKPGDVVQLARRPRDCAARCTRESFFPAA